MQVFENYKNIPKPAQGAVLCIGNFDGVHQGHQKLLETAQSLAQEKKCPCAVLSFEPHPHHLFHPDEPEARITPFAIKKEILAAQGVDILFSLSFDWAFASMEAEDFIQDVLIKSLAVEHVVVGHDFCFGKLRKGSPQYIKDFGVSVSVVDKQDDDKGDEFSSSRIRQALRHGDIESANAILGWEWFIEGSVIKGDQRGRELGFPTANIDLGSYVHPAYGIYASLCQVEGDEKWHGAATNIGIRPMFEVPKAQVETYIFDFDQDLYNQRIRVKPVRRLRGEAKFNDLDDLIEQMHKDCAQAKKILEKTL